MQKHISPALTLQLLGFSLISLVVLLVYYPSLMHCPRADQVMYLAEVAQRNSWWDLAVNTFDLNRHRQFAPGDQLLFRPVMYFFLGTERFFFGYNFLLWQLTGIFLHMAVVWFLLQLLLTIRVGLSSVIAAGVFALLYINMEMVIWHHINGYMIFMVCLLIALRRVWLLREHQGDTQKNLLVLMLSILVGSFTYEPMVLFAILMALLVWVYRPDCRRKIWLLLWPIALYALASWWNAAAGRVTAWEAKIIIVKSQDILANVKDIAWTLWFWLFTSIFSIQVPIRFFARNGIDSQSLQGLFLLKPFPGVMAAIVLIVVGAVYLLRLGKGHWGKVKPFVLMIGAMLVVYSAVIVLGRSNARGLWDVLRSDLYYNYLFCLLTVIMVTVAMDWSVKVTLLTRVMGFAALAIFIYFQAVMLNQATSEQARSNNPILVLVHTVNELIKEKGGERDFSFYVADNYPGNYMYKELVNPHFPGRKFSFIEVLYPQYFRREAAKYSFLTK